VSELKFEDAEVVQISGGGPVGIRDYLGTDHMIGEEPMLTFEARLKNCYHIAGYALAFDSAPESARLVHGSWHGPKAEERIGHAWLEHGPLIWEPIYAAWFDGEALRRYARMWDEATYDKPTAKRMIGSWRHWGRWHESRYP
jgi:hypothetical protein